MQNMLQNILQLIRESGEDVVVNNPAIPEESNNAVMGEAAYAVAGTLQDALANGNVADIIGLFQQSSPQNVMSNPLSQQMQNGFIDRIADKVGINRQTAMTIASVLIPLILRTLVKRTQSNDPNDNGFDIGDLIGSLTGGRQQGGGGLDIGQLIGQFTGGGQQPEQSGGLDIGDLIRQVSGAASRSDNRSGLDDLIKGFFR